MLSHNYFILDNGDFHVHRLFNVMVTGWLISSTPWLIYDQVCKPICAKPGFDKLLKSKMHTAIIHLALETLGMLCRIWTSRLPITCLMSMEVFDVASAACLVILFNVCHHHEPQPSTALSVYLALDFAAKTIFLWRHDGASPWADWRFVSILVLLLKLRLIQLQERSKKDRVGLPNSGFWSSRLGFSILPLLYQARNGPLSKDNIADIPHELHNGRLNRKFEALWSKYRSKKHPLFMVTTMSCKAELFQGILVTVLKSIIKFSIPFWIESVVRFLEHRQTTQSHTGALDIETICVTLQTLTLFLSLAILQSCAIWINNNAALKLRGMFLSALSNKMFGLADHQLAEHMHPSLLTNDIKTIQNSIPELQETVSCFLDSMIVLYIIWHYLGYNIVGTLLAIALFSIASTYVGPPLAVAQENYIASSMLRVLETTRLLRSSKATKIANKTAALKATIAGLHEAELVTRQEFYFRNGIVFAFIVSMYAIIPVFMIHDVSAYLTRNGATIVKYLALSTEFTDDVKYVIRTSERWTHMSLAFSRMKNILQLPNVAEIDAKSRIVSYTPTETAEPSPMIEVISAYIAPALDTPFALRDINLSLDHGSISVITGDVATGKSTLLRGIAGHAPIEAGCLTMADEKIAFCGQDPWLENKSIRDNIVGSAVFFRAWFNVVIQACVLQSEATTLGEHYIVGHNGDKLNRAQRQRVSLARAVYSRDSILLLDDVLSAQSPPVVRMLIHRLFSRIGLLRIGTTVVLTTLQPDLFYGVCDNMFSIDGDGGVRSISASQQIVPAEDPMLFDSNDVAQMDEVVVSPGASRIQEISDSISHAPRIRPLVQSSDEGGFLWSYFQHSNRATIIIWAVILICALLLQTTAAIVVRLWASTGNMDGFPWTKVYLAALLSGPVFALSSILFQEWMVHPSGKIFHQRLLDITVATSISALTAERIEHAINLFSEGSGAITGELATAVYRFLYVLVNTVLICGLVTSWSLGLLCLWPIAILATTHIHSLYVAAFVQLRQMELSISEAMYSNFDENVTGLAHVALSRSEAKRLARTDTIIQDSQRVTYHCQVLELWLKTAINLLLAFIMALFMLICMNTNISPSAIASGIPTMILAAPSLQVAIASLGTAKYFMKAVHQIERFIKYTPQDEPRMILPTNHEWSLHPTIRFADVSIGYGPQAANPTLRGINLQISGASEIGFVGALGSGKTTLSLSLLSLISYTGSITIDGIEVRDIHRDQFPSLFTVIPQEPVVFRTATIRQNLMPNEIINPGNYEGYESVMYRVLYGVGLLKIVEKNGGLRSKFSKLKLSYEQLARFSVAQGLMLYYFMRTPFALVDGATNNVSGESLVRMRAIMREVFGPGGCAIISMVHYQETVSGATWIGRVAEGTVTPPQLPPPVGA